MGFVVSEPLRFSSKVFLLFSCINLHMRKTSTFIFKRLPETSTKFPRQKEKGGVLETKRLHFLAYHRVHFNPSNKIDKP